MSHSQFHSTNLFILRHAWLNLWDKHMTTGRINQVTISLCTEVNLYSTSTRITNAFHGGRSLQGFKFAFVWIPSQSKIVFQPEGVLTILRPAKETPCIPFSQVLGLLSEFFRTWITSLDEDYQQPAIPERHAQPRRISYWLIAFRFSHRQVIHVPRHYKQKSHKDIVW